jgi:hypothetical protein
MNESCSSVSLDITITFNRDIDEKEAKRNRNTTTTSWTYDVIKVRIFATRSVGGNVDSARWTFMVACSDALFDALPAESMTALRVDQRVSVRIHTDGTTEVLIDDGRE